MAMAEINKCTSYSGLLFSYVAFLTSLLGAALPFWITTEGDAFRFINFGFWQFCEEINIEETICVSFVGDTKLDAWLQEARITGMTATVMSLVALVTANLYTIPNTFQGSRVVVVAVVTTSLSSVALVVTTLTLFCLGRDNHSFIDFDGPVRLSHSFYLMMASATASINAILMYVSDVHDTYRKKRYAYKPPTGEFLEQLQNAAAMFRQDQGDNRDLLEDDNEGGQINFY